MNTPKWFKERAYYLNKESHDPEDKIKAFERGLEWGEKIPFGLFYKENKPAFEDNLLQIKEKPLVKHDISDVQVEALLKNLL